MYLVKTAQGQTCSETLRHDAGGLRLCWVLGLEMTQAEQKGGLGFVFLHNYVSALRHPTRSNLAEGFGASRIDPIFSERRTQIVHRQHRARAIACRRTRAVRATGPRIRSNACVLERI